MFVIYEKIAILTTLIISISLISSVSIIPLIHNIGIKFNLIDKPDFRKTHKGQIVRLGGLGIFIGLFFGLILLYLFKGQIDFLSLESKDIFLLFIGSFSFLTIGLIDDLVNLSPYVRLGFQFLLTIILFSQGLRIEAIDTTWINSSLNYLELNKLSGIIFVSIWVVGLTNAINWLDGLDSLASGITLIAIVALSSIFITMEKWDLFFICAAYFGAIIGFLRYNIYPAKIMMGDCGSYFLGSSLGILSIIGLSFDSNVDKINTDILLDTIKVFPIHIALIIFFVPLFDMTYVVSTRIIKGHSPFFPDRNHIHHKFLNKGLNERSTSTILFSISILFGILALYLFGVQGNVFYFCGAFIILLISFLYLVNLKIYLSPMQIQEKKR